MYFLRWKYFKFNTRYWKKLPLHLRNLSIKFYIKENSENLKIYIRNICLHCFCAVENCYIKFKIKVYEVIYIYRIWNLIYAFLNFNMDQSVDKTEYFLNSLITCKSLKLADNIFNQFNHQYYLIFFVNYLRNIRFQK